MYRMWAFRRRLIYGIGFALFLVIFSTLIYVLFIRSAPSCFDGRLNGGERGIDCGGACERVCASDTQPPRIVWAKSFEIAPGVYHAVAYVENRNLTVGTKDLNYTFRLRDASGAAILEKRGRTFLPPDSVYPVFEARLETQGRVPAETTLLLDPVTEWQEFASAREQFSVGARALSGVDVRPRLEAEITNNALTDARDVEVVATIFDQQKNALTASRTVVPLFEGRTTKTVIFTWPQPIAKTLRSCEVPTDIVLAMDLSGSMNNDGGTPPQPITASLEAASAFIKRLKQSDQAAVATFATEGALPRTLTRDKTTVAALIEQLTIDPEEERGSTNIGDAIELGVAELASERHSGDARKVLILFTDGKATAPEPDPNAHARTAIAKAREEGITVFTVGLGNDLDRPLLSELATTPEYAYTALTTGELDAIYRSITSSICEDGPAVIDIVPKIIGDLNDAQRR